MTLVAGFVCRDGLLICADMEETGVGSKRKINKLFYRAFGDYRLVLTGAGSSAVIDNAIKRVDDAIAGGVDVTNAAAILKGKDAESEEAQEHANSSSLALYA